MIGLSAIGALLFFLPGILASVEFQIGDTTNRQKLTPQATSTPQALGLIGLISALIHLILVALLGLISQFPGLDLFNPSINLDPKAMSGHSVLLSLAYTALSCIAGYGLGVVYRRSDAKIERDPGTISRLFQLEQQVKSLDLVAFVYLKKKPSDASPDGMVGLVSRLLRKADNSIAWVELTDPNPFVLTMVDGIATLEETAVRRSDDTAPDAEQRPVVHIDQVSIARVVFGLYARPEGLAETDAPSSQP